MVRTRLRFLRLCLLLVLVAAPSPSSAGREGTGLPLPRFVTLRAAEANMRTGPGNQYPIKWTYRRPGLPLEVTAEFDHWRRVRDFQGAEGWMHSSMLSTKRSFIVVGDVQPLRARASGDSPLVARIESKVIGRLRSCPKGGDWCEVEVDGTRGWLSRGQIWGVRDGEVVD